MTTAPSHRRAALTPAPASGGRPAHGFSRPAQTTLRRDDQRSTGNPRNWPVLPGLPARPAGATRTHELAHISEHEPKEVPVSGPAGIARLNATQPAIAGAAVAADTGPGDDGGLLP
jgi:hypothetical protein